jgi:phosphate transport system permease protein
LRGKQALAEGVATVVMWAVAAVVGGVIVWVVADVLLRGAGHLSLGFLLEEPAAAGREGGVGTVIVSTVLILAVTVAAAVPVSVATAIVLAEHSRGASWFAGLVRRSLDVLAAVPSVVFGLFGNAFFCIALGMGYSILAGGLTLACMVLPILIRTTEQALRAVPDEHRCGAAALGFSRTATLLRIELPAAIPAMSAGLVLGIGRALSETAILMFTSGYSTRMPESLLDSGRALSVHIYFLAMNVPGGNDQAYATASVLIALLLVINVAAARMTYFAAGTSHVACRTGAI